MMASQPTIPPRPNLSLHIGTLSLPSASTLHAQRIGAALRAELASLLGRSPTFDPSQPRRLDAGTIKLDLNEHPAQVGRCLARAIAATLLQPRADTTEREP